MPKEIKTHNVFTCKGCGHILHTDLFGDNIGGKDYCCLCDLPEYILGTPAPVIIKPKEHDTI